MEEYSAPYSSPSQWYSSSDSKSGSGGSTGARAAIRPDGAEPDSEELDLEEPSAAAARPDRVGASAGEGAGGGGLATGGQVTNFRPN